MWNEFTVDRSIPGDRGRIKMVKFAETMSSVLSHTNITFSPDYDFSSLPHIDILFIPGGKEAWRKYLFKVDKKPRLNKASGIKDNSINVCKL